MNEKNPRLQKSLARAAKELNSSIATDQRLIQEDIQGSLAHSAMLAHCHILSKEDVDQIQQGLRRILTDFQEGNLTIDPEAEDIHMYVEEELTRRIGQAGKKLHTARSRNDQAVTDMRLYVKKQIPLMQQQLAALIRTMIQCAEENTDTVMPGYTHMQVAQAVTFGHHLMAYVQMLLRDYTRFSDCLHRMDECPLGSGALAGTIFPIDRFYTSQALGFRAPSKNSMDAVADRDHLLELHFCLSTMMMHLSRLSEEMLLWASQEFKFVEIDDSYATGSSIMPQKKNPDIAELIRGKTGGFYGRLLGALTMMKALPMTYNKDMQEDKQPLFESLDTASLCLQAMEGMIRTLTVRKETMATKAKTGFINATDCADYLTAKGMGFRDAYALTGALVLHCTQTGQTLEELDLDFLKSCSPLFEEDIYKALRLETILLKRNIYGGPAPEAVKLQIQETKKLLEEQEAKSQEIGFRECHSPFSQDENKSVSQE